MSRGEGYPGCLGEGAPLELDSANSRTRLDWKEIFLYHLHSLSFSNAQTIFLPSARDFLYLDKFWMA